MNNKIIEENILKDNRHELNSEIEYIYLIKPLAKNYSKYNIFKFGQTITKNNIINIENYNDNIDIILLINCTNSKICEQIIKTKFKKDFIYLHDEEYFIGDKNDIKNEIIKIIFGENSNKKQKISLK